MHPAPFVFFSHLALVSGLTKWKVIEKIANAVDYVIDRALPFLRKWSYDQILALEKEMKDSERSFST